GEESYAPRSDTCLEIIRLNALAAETPFRPSLALSLAPLFPSRSLYPRSSVASLPIALSLPPPFPSRSLSPLPSRRPLSRRPLSPPSPPIALSLSAPFPSPSLPSPSLPSPSLSPSLCPVALSPVTLSPVALSPIALALSFALSRRPLPRRPLPRRPLSLTSPALCPVAHALSRRPRSLPSPREIFCRLVILLTHLSSRVLVSAALSVSSLVP
ncbi:unnamed protein product, partial [Closterium sp. NIES-64]